MSAAIRPAASGDWPTIVALVSASGLPTSDLAPTHVGRFLVARAAPEASGEIASGEIASGEIVGCAAVEPYGDHGLLRSVAVAPEARGQGLGGALVDAAVARAADLGIARLVLLTDTAEAFFRARGWTSVEREALPLAVRQSSEFSGSCCACAASLWRPVPTDEPTRQGEPA